MSPCGYQHDIRKCIILYAMRKVDTMEFRDSKRNNHLIGISKNGLLVEAEFERRKSNSNGANTV